MTTVIPANIAGPTFDPAASLYHYVADHADRRPDAAAVLLADHAVSYGDLLDLAEGAACALRAAGVGKGDFVGLYATRSLKQLAGMLGIQRAGATCVPLDPSYADQTQLRQIAEQVPFAATLHSADLAADARTIIGPKPPGIGLETVAPVARSAEGWPRIDGDDPACMVFTSGTTGTPKGVVLSQRGLAAFTLNQPVIGLRPDDVMLHASSLACDGGLIEVWSALLAGASLALVEAAKPALPDIAATMTCHKVTVTSQYVGMHNLIVEHDATLFSTVRLAMAGGDVLSQDHIRRLKAECADLTMVNIYGPSETTCISLVRVVTEADLKDGPIPIGEPLDHEHAFILDDSLTPVADGVRGQLAIGGAGVALGYFGMPEKTAEAFIDDPRQGARGKVYLTGDLALRRSDGVFEFHGRVDRQVKLGGRRVELDGIEHVLRHCRGVRDAFAFVVNGPKGDARIGALFTAAGDLPDDRTAWLRGVLDEAGAALHPQMLPRHCVVLDELPLTRHGKPDRSAMRDAVEATLTVAAAGQPAAPDAIQETIARVWDDLLGCGPLPDSATFFDAGGTSLQLIGAHARLQEVLGVTFDLMLLFESPRLNDLAGRLSEMGASADGAGIMADSPPPEDTGNAIAIIGLAARVPGAGTLEAFWDHMRNGDNLIRRFTADELQDAAPPEIRADPAYVPARSVLEDVDLFDARYFDILPREAELIDPQARVFLELCVEALDDAGLDPARTGGPIGVYAGCSTSTYMLNNVMADRDRLEAFTSGFQIDNYTTLTGNITDTLSTRVAFKLNLKGPAMTLHTACSTSLTAIAQAVTGLRAGQCDVALAGGISITFPQQRGYLAQEGGMASPDGLCRPFDERAGGTVFGHGGGVLVLKRLDRALADGDRIDAVIRGVGLNNDGADKMSFTAPAVTGQADAIRAAHRDAGIAPETIGFVECHGTATPLGDPIEIRALAQAFGDMPAGTRVALGSVKGNIGHLDAGAGAVSVIKTVHMLRRREIPPVAHFTAPNPRIEIEKTPFFVPAAAEAWISDSPLRAGVSGFGVGGTNVHVVLEEAPQADAVTDETPDPVQILPLSAKSPEALAQMAEALADTLEHAEAADLPDAALTLQDGRRVHPFRLAVAASERGTAAARLRAAPQVTRAAQPQPAPVAFMFPGQGAQYPGMGSGLYRDVPAYATWIDRGCEILKPLLGLDLRRFLAKDSGDASALTETRLAQPALFLVQYATAKLWEARGVSPASMIGHSVGEFAAATLAGVMEFEAALQLVATRGRLMQGMEPGAMLSVRAPLDALSRFIDGPIDLAAANAPEMHVLAGPKDAIDELAAQLAAQRIAARKLRTSHAFHSRMMQPAVDALRGELAAVALKAPQRPIVSSVTGDWITDAEATDPAYWAGQARATVQFAKAVAALTAGRTPALLEVGAGTTLSTLAARTLAREARAAVVHSLPGPDRTMTDSEAMGTALGHLWSAGVTIDWAQASRRGHRKLRLPGTVFQRKRHWIDAVPPRARAADPSAPSSSAPMPVTAPIPEPRPMPTPAAAAPRKSRLTDELLALFSELSGEDLTSADVATPFLELGFDSLFMGQAAQALLKNFGVELTFRSLLSDFPSLDAVAAHLDATLPADPAPDLTAEAAPASPDPAPSSVPAASVPEASTQPGGGVEGIIQAQMLTMQKIFAEQLRAVGAAPATASPLAPVAEMTPPTVARPKEKEATTPIGFAVGRSPSAAQAELTPAQRDFAANLAGRYEKRFAGSKAHTQAHRDVHADPRTAAGFRAEWKELTFPIVASRARGAYLEDVDGNRLVDLVNGFGQTAFGHSPDFVSKAVAAQMERGYPIGPQSDIAGPVAKRFARMVGHERVTFCNTGSEAVMAAMRLARAVTGRDKVVVFGDDYHGQFDEVLVKGKTRSGPPAALPIAPGIPRSSVSNMVVLPFGEPESLTWITDNIAEVAAVVVEPVQSRSPELRPADFVRSLRQITEDGGAALVLDEVVTGFRTHARGMQGVWDIRADMATYGKVVGGGMPVGVLAGNRRFMDALDGGTWSYGDDSVPQVAPTFFAGTFVRHPLVVAAVDAVLEHLETDGAALWSDTASRTADLVGRMNAALARRGLPDLVKHYSSWFVIKVSQHDPRATLLFPLMRLNGVHVLDGFCGFMTTTHGAEECDSILAAFEAALDELQAVGILTPQDGIALQPAANMPAAPVPLTESQREIWMTHQLGDMPAAAFNESVSLRLSGALDATHLRAALGDVIRRHDALRLRFARDGQTFTVAEATQPDLPVIDVSTASDPQAALDDILAQNAVQPLDIVAGPPIRAALIRLAASEHVLTLTVHHIVCDGWSHNVLARELAALYTARLNGVDADLPPAGSFAAMAERTGTCSPKPATKAYWHGAFAKLPALLDLPTDRPRPLAKSFAGATTSAQIGPNLVKRLRKAGAPLGCTLFSMLFAGLQITLGRLAGSGSVVLGVPTAGQSRHPSLEIVGHLVNFLPVRADFEDDETARSHVERVSRAVMAAMDHADYTFGTLVRDLDVPRDLNRLPITEVQFNLERLPQKLAFGPAAARMAANPKAAVNFDLFFNMVECREGLRIDVDFSTALFDASTIRRWIAMFETVIDGLATALDRPIGALPVMDAKEEARLADSGTPQETDFDRAASLPDLIARSIAAHSDAVAACDAERALTYAELARESDALAALIQERLPEPGARVGVAVPRGVGMLVALLAVLKAGHAYVPLDPAQPLARQRAVLEQARTAAVIAPPGTELATADCPLIDPADATDGTPRPVGIDPESAAYVIFTSGSTGKPKGVAVPHRAVVNFLTSMAGTPGMTRDDRLLCVTTISFDIVVLELFLPLIVGASLEIASKDDILDGFRILDRLQGGEVTMMQATPTYWAMLAEIGLKPAPGLTMLAGGEPLPFDIADRLTANGATLWNMYGPTETTIWSSVAKVERGQPITIGAPIANTELHVLDPQDRLCPVGVAGELNIGGAGLALGYFDRPDLTEAAFRDVTLAGCARRLYRTGDMAIRNADGSLRLLGRSDGQIKLRGNRIELGEIEAHMRSQPGVAAAAVALKTAPSGMDQLVGYLCPRDGAQIVPGEIAAALATSLPDYMVPSGWMVLDTLPQTANGKLDRKALPDPGNAPPLRIVRNVEAPATATESAIAAIWREVLALDELSVTDTLFTLGVDSLAVFRLAARLMQNGLSLEARDLLAHPSVRELAAHADSGRAAPRPARPALKDFARTPKRTGT